MIKKTMMTLSLLCAVYTVTPLHPDVQAAEQGMLSTPLKSLNRGGESVTLGNYKGKVILLDFWASWCIPCRKSFPFYEKLQHKYGKEGLVIVGVNNEDDVEAATKFYKSYGVTFLVARDESNALVKAMNPGEMPTTYIIDRQGNVAFTQEGFNTGDEAKIEEKVKELLGH